jgi:hypothetical protein
MKLVVMLAKNQVYNHVWDEVSDRVCYVAVSCSVWDRSIRGIWQVVNPFFRSIIENATDEVGITTRRE